jgi:two-component system sensor histidine kinase QseC
LIITVFNLHDSNHEIAEVYDAQLAQNARLLQGVMRMPMASKEHAELYQAFNSTLGQAEPKVDGHPYESKIAFQVWNSQGAVLVHTASAPSFTAPPVVPGFSDVVDQKGRKWRAFVLDDEQYGLKIWVGERDDVRADLVDRIVRHAQPDRQRDIGRGDLAGHRLGPQAAGRYGGEIARQASRLPGTLAADAAPYGA